MGNVYCCKRPEKKKQDEEICQMTSSVEGIVKYSFYTIQGRSTISDGNVDE
jgi:hypothetical protein